MQNYTKHACQKNTSIYNKPILDSLEVVYRVKMKIFM